MELTELLCQTKKLFDVENTGELTQKLKRIAIDNIFEFHKEFADIVGNLNEDLLQKIYQYYEADREEKKQDYTPKTIGVLLCELLGKCQKVYDQCAGSGSLTIQYWSKYPDTEFICEELDENVIPYLLFNLSVRNISGYVVHNDILKNEVYHCYRLTKGDRFSTVNEVGQQDVDYKNIDGAISNPPYNIKWTIPDFATFDSRFMVYGIPPSSNANYAFMLNALDKADRCAFVLPNGVLSSENAEKDIRRALIDNNVIDAVITLPDKMFASTSIPTCILVLDKNRSKNRSDNKIHMLDMFKECIKETREQKGQYGNNAQTSRVYKRDFNVFSSANIRQCINAINSGVKVDGLYAPALKAQIKSNGYNLTPRRYITIDDKYHHRPIKEIAGNINDYVKDKNVTKITINETLAKAIGLYDVYLIQEKSNEIMREWNERAKNLDIHIEEEHFIALSKKKNEIKIEQQDKEIASELIMQIINSWKSHIMYLNNKQNLLLCELRDAFMNELMSGKMQI